MNIYKGYLTGEHVPMDTYDTFTFCIYENIKQGAWKRGVSASKGVHIQRDFQAVLDIYSVSVNEDRDISFWIRLNFST
jgi:hypothetical protein